jgi:hypothetical protein
MEKRYQHTVNGQSVLTADLNVLGESSALADDRVFAELFRLAPYDGATISRGVLPYGSGAVVAAAGASGSVSVRPFRALVGSRTAVATDAKKNWRDIRSAIGVGTTTLAQTVALAANATGNPRWDLVYAAVAVDANSASITRKVKDPTTKAIAGQSLVTTLETVVTLGVVAGTAGASPAFPSLPADSGGTYYISLAHVRIPNGFGASSTVAAKDIDEVAPILPVSTATGASSLRPANQHNVIGGVAISGAGTSTANGALKWSGSSATRPGLYLPPSMSGSESLIIEIDLGNASSANWSHQNADIVDNSRDWRNRFWRWHAHVGSGATNAGKFPGGAATVIGYSSEGTPGFANDADYVAHASGLGSSFDSSGTDAAVAIVSASGPAATQAPSGTSNISTYAMAPATRVRLYVDTATGALLVNMSVVQ